MSRMTAALDRPAAMAGPLFIGRNKEIGAFNDALGRACKGESVVLMVSGAPGIGKTRAAQHMAAQAAARDALVLWGGCPKKPGAPPYWPWLQMLRTYIKGNDVDAVRADIGSAAEYIVRLDATLAVQLGLSRPPERPSYTLTTISPNDQFQLFEEMASLWQRVSTRQPLLLVFDDMHCADVETLKLVEHVALECSSTRIMLLATYRSAEVSRRHAMSDTLSALTCLAGFQRIPLHGFCEHETTDYVRAIGCAPHLAQVLHERTEGHPLFLAEVTRPLRDERDAISSVANFDPMRVPDGVRHIVGSWLNRLSSQCNHALSRAAVIGRQFDFWLLAVLIEELTEDRCLAAIDEAIKASLIRESPEPGVYQFTQMLIRDAIYEEVPAPRRMRLHQQIGTAIEIRHEQDLQPWLSILAYHFQGARTPGSAHKAVEYATRAAREAESVQSYEEAARLYTLALQSLSAARQADRCELLLSLGEVRLKLDSYESALESFAEAAAAARKTGSPVALTRAALGYEQASRRTSGLATASVALLRDALDAIHPGDSAQRARLLAALARALIARDDAEAAISIHQQAVAMARRLNDRLVLFAALSSIVPARCSKVPLALRLNAGREAMRLAELAGNQRWAFSAMLLQGQQNQDGTSTSLLEASLSACLDRGMHWLELRALTHQQPTPTCGRASYPRNLTEREVQVLRMVAGGKTNQDIADTLVRSPNTVACHVRNILAKIGAANRTEAAAFAMRHKLADP